ncbi:Low molecular weight phosphotyrosine protein phosphatase [Tritrichomonas musculus]|uniref:Low molecular weight phosphotyrosine protein phosphatase n=1 Tax=Tritrichomonas musculus TaxID=1915356 RepID=A0ABR2K1B7_9EUKA
MNNSLDESQSILFVCIGNICRSPACEAICKSLFQNSNFQSNPKHLNMKISSAAMAQFHLNESPDFRIQDVCLRNGIDISNYRAKQIKKIDWLTYNYIVALDPSIYNILQNMKPVDSKAKLLLFNAPNGIADPYYGGKLEFTRMFKEIQMNMEPFLINNKIL